MDYRAVWLSGANPNQIAGPKALTKRTRVVPFHDQWLLISDENHWEWLMIMVHHDSFSRTKNPNDQQPVVEWFYWRIKCRILMVELASCQSSSTATIMLINPGSCTPPRHSSEKVIPELPRQLPGRTQGCCAGTICWLLSIWVQF